MSWGAHTSSNKPITRNDLPRVSNRPGIGSPLPPAPDSNTPPRHIGDTEMSNANIQQNVSVSDRVEELVHRAESAQDRLGWTRYNDQEELTDAAIELARVVAEMSRVLQVIVSAQDHDAR